MPEYRNNTQKIKPMRAAALFMAVFVCVNLMGYMSVSANPGVSGSGGSGWLAAGSMGGDPAVTAVAADPTERVDIYVEGVPVCYGVEAADADRAVSGMKGVLGVGRPGETEGFVQEVSLRASSEGSADYKEAVAALWASGLSVITVEEDIVSTAIPFDIRVTYDTSLRFPRASETVAGADGRLDRITRTTYADGVPISVEVFEEVAAEPVRREVVVGVRGIPQSELFNPGEIILPTTKDAIPGVASGVFIQPCVGELTSGYGYRDGGFHGGIDIAASYGTPIFAADGGTVEIAGNEGTYGLLVTINHGNGFVSYYGHNSRLLVRQGESVAQGQMIALMGSTGYSTGNHCHYELRYNGDRVNPLSYTVMNPLQYAVIRR